MDDFNRGLLSEFVLNWSVTQLELYIHEQERRVAELNEWIKHLKTIKKKKARQVSVDTGARGGT